MKTFQIRKNFSPFISDITKDIILNRKALLEEAAKTDCKILKGEVDQLGKTIKREIENDRTKYFENKFKDKEDSPKSWRTSY